MKLDVISTVYIIVKVNLLPFVDFDYIANTILLYF